MIVSLPIFSGFRLSIIKVTKFSMRFFILKMNIVVQSRTWSMDFFARKLAFCIKGDLITRFATILIFNEPSYSFFVTEDECIELPHPLNVDFSMFPNAFLCPA